MTSVLIEPIVNEVIDSSQAVTVTVALQGAPGAPGSTGPTSLSLQFGDGSVALGSGGKVVTRVPFVGTLTKITVLADQVCSAVLDIKKTDLTGYPGSLVSICFVTKPTLASQVKVEDSTLTGWTTGVVVDDILEVTLESVSTCTRVSLVLYYERI